MHKTSCVYILQFEEGLYKIGCSVQAETRLKTHKQELPPFTVRHMIKSNCPLWAERYLHSVLRQFALGGERFALGENALSWLLSLSILDRYNEPTPPSFEGDPRVPSRPRRYSKPRIIRRDDDVVGYLKTCKVKGCAEDAVKLNRCWEHYETGRHLGFWD